MAFVDRAALLLRAAGVRVQVDTRFNLRPGNKFYEWERKGIPLRMEMGPRDMQSGCVLCARRFGGDGSKFKLELGEGFGEAVLTELASMQGALLAAAELRLQQRTIELDTYAQMQQVCCAAESVLQQPYCATQHTCSRVVGERPIASRSHCKLLPVAPDFVHLTAKQLLPS